jgi:SAM-dependent methyltransferase
MKRQYDRAVVRSLASLVSIALVFSQGFDRDAAERKRDAATQQPRLLDIGAVAPGMVVGEVGAGSGYLTFHLAARVGPAGRVYANDILEQAIEVIRSRAAKKGLANVVAVLGAKDDPLFPTNGLERVFFLESFHEIRPPDAFLAKLASYLKPDAKAVIWELESDGTPLLDGEHRYTRQEMTDIVARSPFRIDLTDEDFPSLDAPGHHPVAYVLSLRGEPGPPEEPRVDAWRKEILDIHRSTSEAHWKKDARFFAENMADGYFALKNGDVLFPTREETLKGFEQYLGTTDFSEYRDIRPPIIGFSRDGSVAWAICQVKVAGRDLSEPGPAGEFALVWAWITLYERRDGRWVWLGESSSFKRVSPTREAR